MRVPVKQNIICHQPRVEHPSHRCQTEATTSLARASRAVIDSLPSPSSVSDFRHFLGSVVAAKIRWFRPFVAHPLDRKWSIFPGVSLISFVDHRSGCRNRARLLSKLAYYMALVV